jgi:hypothetical protein
VVQELEVVEAAEVALVFELERDPPAPAASGCAREALAPLPVKLR